MTGSNEEIIGESSEYKSGMEDGVGDIFEKYASLSSRFAYSNRLTTRDLNNNTTTPTFTLYSKDNITDYLSNPYKYEKQLRNAVTYIYGASPHFRRLIQYFVGLSDFSYIIEPYKIDPKKVSSRSLNNNYRKTLNILSSLNLKTQGPKVLTVCLREDVFYCTMWVLGDSVTFQQLPSDYCAISSIEGNVPNVTFDFSYFDSHEAMLDYYPDEFRKKYEEYKNDRMNKWIELDSPTSFAVKCNSDILDYAIPPFAGILREIYDLEDYRQLKMSKTALENYAMVAMKLPMNSDTGEWGIDFKKAREIWLNLNSVLPEEVGSILTPMDVEKLSFERTHTGDTDTIAEAEQNLFTAAGVSSLLFNNEKASANALTLSIKADQSITYGIVKNLEAAINRFLQAQPYGKNFKINILDCSPYNRKELGDAYLKSASYGLPTVSLYAASQGLGQAELDSMAFLENEVLKLPETLIPLRNSAQLSSDGEDEGGAPTKDIGELSDSGEESSEKKDDWG